MFEKTTLYLLKVGKYYKIGITNDLKARLSGYRTHCPYEVREIATKVFETRDHALQTEQQLIVKYQEYNHRGEWFVFKQEVLKEVLHSFEERKRKNDDKNDPFKQGWIPVFCV